MYDTYICTLHLPNIRYFLLLDTQGERGQEYYLRVISYDEELHGEVISEDESWYDVNLYEGDYSEGNTVYVLNGQTLNYHMNPDQSIVEVSDEVLLSLHEDLIPLPGQSMKVTKNLCVGLWRLKYFYREKLERVLEKTITDNKKLGAKDLELILRLVIEEVNQGYTWLPISEEEHFRLNDNLSKAEVKEKCKIDLDERNERVTNDIIERFESMKIK